jgi:hypothetical protein
VNPERAFFVNFTVSVALLPFAISFVTLPLMEKL